MKISVTILAVAAALGAVSCGGNSPPPEQAANQLPSDGVAAAPVGAGGTTVNEHAAAVRIDGDAPPKDAHYTLFCDAVTGPDHVLRATQFKQDLMRKTGLRGWHLLHTEDRSSIFYGYYNSFDDRQNRPADFARAHADLQMLNALKNSDGERLFKTSMFVPLNEPDPEAPSKWNLANARPAAYWSLQVAAYRGSPERKQYAVDAVRAMRSKGIEAYYFHGDNISSVCVGAWPRDAIKRQDADAAATVDPNKRLLVVNTPLPANTSPEIRDKEGNDLLVQAPKLEILDPKLAKAIRDFPNHAINGFYYSKKSKDGQEFVDPSFLVVVPNPASESTPVAQNTVESRDTAIDSGAADDASNAILDNTAAGPRPRASKLRGIGQ